MAESVAWILTTSGVGLRDSAAKIKTSFRNADIVDIEDNLLSQRATVATLKELKIEKRIESMKDLISYLPRNLIRKLWEEAVKNSVHELEENERKRHSSLKIITGHALYFGGKRREFYSVLNTEVLKKELQNSGLAQVRHIAFLTDDIFDMYLRLRREDQIFDWKEATEEYLKQTQSERKIESLTELDRYALAELCTQWEFDSLRRLQIWRYLGTVIAENAAYQLDAHFLLWGVKQPIKGLVEWFQGSKSIYLSHVISSLRERQSSTGTWDPLVNEINSLPNHLATLGITCAMPTALDEVRFEYENNRAKRCTGVLRERWPLQGKMEDLLFVPVDGEQASDMTHKELLLPKTWNFKTQALEPLNQKPGSEEESAETKKHSERLYNRLSQLTEDLAEQASFQVALRDHLLVSHADMILVYRPFYGGKTAFSSGVAAEVKHWADSAVAGGTRAAFVHFDEDVHGMLNTRLKEGEGPLLKKSVEAIVAEIIKKKTGIRKADVVDDLVRFVIRRSASPGILAGIGVDAKTKRNVVNERSKILDDAECITLQTYLTAETELPSASAGVFVFEELEKCRKGSRVLCDFAKSGKPNSNGWERRISSLFPVEVL